MGQYIQAAFESVCEDNKKPGCWYVILVSTQQCYGGPEEGGWWYSTGKLEAYKEYPTEELAEEAREKVKVLADELQANSRRAHGEHCLRQLEWLDARGLDADYLPEDDGPEEYEVSVVDELPVFDNRRPHYC